MRRLLLGTLSSLYFLLGMVLPTFAQSTGSSTIEMSVQGVIGGQIEAFRHNQHDKAFGFAAPSIKKYFGSTERFIDMVRSGYGAIYGARDWNFGRSHKQGGEFHQEVRITGPNGLDWVALYTLQQQADGSWRITSVQLVKADVLST